MLLNRSFSFINITLEPTEDGQQGASTEQAVEKEKEVSKENVETSPLTVESTEKTKSVSLAPDNTNRAYSPIIEDPSERDSRPPSTDLADSGAKNDDVPSRAVSPAAVPVSSVSPIPGQSRPMSPISSSSQSKTPEPASPTPGKDDKNDVASKSTNATTNQPIFKPLTTDKGKSKTTGKNIGGWI